MKNKPFLLLFAVAALAFAGCSDGSNDKDDNSSDLCPQNDAKTSPGVCGCDMSDDDSDGDGLEDCFDLCPNDPNKFENGACGCGVPDVDKDGNTIPDCLDEKSDLCPEDPNKTAPGICGCGEEDVDTDEDGTFDCMDLCPEDPLKVQGGICGCGVSDEDSDGDTIPDCIDKCYHDALKVLPGICGCEVEDSYFNTKDTDGDDTPDCIDLCPTNPYKTAPGESGCDVSDSDGDGVDDPFDDCPFNPNVQELSEEDSPTKCNYVNENGEKIFEIWSAEDLTTLRSELKTLMPDVPLGMPCDDSYQLKCDGGVSAATNAIASRCSAGTDRVVEQIHCYEGCVVKDDGADLCMEGTAPVTPETVPETCTETSNPSALYDCCTAENFADQCGEKGVLTCANGMVRLKTACTAECNEAACVACIPVAEDESNKGKLGTCCDANTFVESCDGSSAIQCVNGRIQKTECMDSCIDPAEGSRFAGCFVSSALEKPILKVRLMRDIDMSEAKEVKVHSSVGCSAAWEPISLYHVDFNGNNKSIKFTDGSQSCALNNAVFDYVLESDVRDLSMNYNLEGLVVGVLARGISHSRISNIKFNGTVHLSIAAYSETLGELAGLANGMKSAAAHYGMLSPWISNSRVSDIRVEGTFVNDSKTQNKVGLVAGAMIGSGMTGVENAMSRVSCAGTACGSVMYSGSNLMMDDVSVDIAHFNGQGNLSGLAISSAGIKNIQNVNVSVKNLESTASFSGFGDDVKNIASSSLKVENVINIAENAEDKPSELNGIGAKAGQISHVEIDIQKSSNVNVNAISRDGASVTDSTVHVAEAQGRNAVVGVFGTLKNAKLDKLTVNIDKADVASVDLASSVSDSEISELSWTQSDVTASKSAAVFPAINNSNISGSVFELGNVKLAAADVALSGFAKSFTSSTMVDTQIHAAKLDSASNVYGLAEAVKADSVIEYTGVQIDEMISATSAGTVIGSLEGTFSNVAVYAVMKVLAPAKPETEDEPAKEAEVYGIAKSIGKATLKDIVSMARMYTYTRDESGEIASSDEVKKHLLFATADATLENIWWFKRSEEHVGQEILVGEEDKSPSSFTSDQVDEVLGSFAENSWKTIDISEDSSTLSLPWPDKKPEAKPEDNPEPPENPENSENS